MNPVAVITGGTGGLGRAIVPRLANRGFKMGVSYVIPAEAAELEEQTGLDEDRLMLRRVDSTDSEALNGFFKEVRAEMGPIGVVIALVGGWAGGRDVEETDDVRFERMLDLNLRSAFYAVRSAVPHLRESGRGRIILIGSRAAYEAPPGQAAFNIAKAGVAALAKSVAHELTDTEITANAILPSLIDTEATRTAVPFADFIDLPKPADIASVVDFLCMDESQVINGAAIPTYGKT